MAMLYDHVPQSQQPTNPSKSLNFHSGALFFWVESVFYVGIVRELFTTELTLRCMGTAVILLTGAGYALSARARSISWLLVPFLCGRAGRSALVTASVSLILRGPIESMMINSKVAVDSFMCLGALSYNHTKERLLLMYKPIKRIIWDFDEQAKVIHNETSAIDQEVKPIEKEVSGDDRETRALEADAEYVDKVSDNDPRSKLVREKYQELKQELESDGEIEADYAKKLELRCEGTALVPAVISLLPLGMVFSVIRTLDIPQLHSLDAAFLGKRTCDGMQPINAGFGQSISAMEAVKREFDANFRVNVQYKLITPEDAINVISPEDLAKGVQAEFENRHRVIPLISIALSRLFAVVLLSAVLEAKNYVEKYLDDLAFDNIYVTEYFCKIDERRARKVILINLDNPRRLHP
ncbi:protein sneaky-like [Dermacentor andersoni]|uniref:protein sneaky-like n=1 Tax=Dermacentor andersoni TaxID=34620 RepID=UPI003B3AF8C8